MLMQAATRSDPRNSFAPIDTGTCDWSPANTSWGSPQGPAVADHRGGTNRYGRATPSGQCLGLQRKELHHITSGWRRTGRARRRRRKRMDKKDLIRARCATSLLCSPTQDYRWWPCVLDQTAAELQWGSTSACPKWATGPGPEATRQLGLSRRDAYHRPDLHHARL